MGSLPHTWTVQPFTRGIRDDSFAHATGLGTIPLVAALEQQGWVRVGPVPNMTGTWMMRRGNVQAKHHERRASSRRSGVAALAPASAGHAGEVGLGNHHEPAGAEPPIARRFTTPGGANPRPRPGVPVPPIDDDLDPLVTVDIGPRRPEVGPLTGENDEPPQHGIPPSCDGGRATRCPRGMRGTGADRLGGGVEFWLGGDIPCIPPQGTGVNRGTFRRRLVAHGEGLIA